MIRPLAILPLALMISACGRLPLFPNDAAAPEPTLADLQPVIVDHGVQPLPETTLAELAVIYREVLNVTEDPATRLLVQHRLADIEMLDGEAGLAAADADYRAFDNAIEAYESLLRDYPDNPMNDQLIYQLSKAYELSGNNEKSIELLEQLSSAYPESGHLLEAEFRKAESYFIAADYVSAERSYSRVISFGEESQYYIKAQYMRGWSRFKLNQYRQSIGSFTATLDGLVPKDSRIENLARGERELAEDCLRVLAVVFSYLEGADSIAAAYEAIGVRPYQHLFYEALGEHYLGQERYRDSAETYRAYTSLYPDSKFAHLLQLRVVESYEAGGFPDLIVQEKQYYVELFGVTGSYWKYSNPIARDAILPKLKLFISELAGYYHALAQDISKAGKKPALAAEHYRTAGDYYELFVDSFPREPEVPGMGFLLAESRFEAGEYRDAIEAYQWVAYQFMTYERAADAGYSAILAQGRLLEHPGADEDETQALMDERIDSELQFARIFSNDTRAPAVLGHAADTLLELEEYQAAISAAMKLSLWDNLEDDALLISAALVMGHSHFELRQYRAAEEAYQSALQMIPEDDKRFGDVRDAMAASIYRQAEEAVAKGNALEAAQQFSRVVEVAPQSEIRVNAQFDAANSYMAAGNLAQANDMFIDFRDRYPRNALSATIGAVLIGNYERLQMWGAAAGELDGIHGRETDAEQKRQALYLAAQYYDEAGDYESARLRYRSYAHEWPQPLAIQMESMNRLSELYEQAADQQRQYFWLEKMITAHDKAGAEQSERSLFLAAKSSSVLADDKYEIYRGIKLNYPIKKSLKKKKRSMESALAAFEKTNAYGVQQYATRATYHMASIYDTLSDDLMNSERPGNIDALALEQYDLLLEEQAYPFEEKAIAIHESNARRAWEGVYDEWVRASFVSLGDLLPARYRKKESLAVLGETVNAVQNPHVGGQSALDDQSQTESAERWFQQRIAKDNYNLVAYNQYAIFLRDQGRFVDAERIYLDAIVVFEPSAITHRNLGILYDLYMGRQANAVIHFKRYQALTESQDRAVEGWIADLERQLMTVVKGDA